MRLRYLIPVTLAAASLVHVPSILADTAADNTKKNAETNPTGTAEEQDNNPRSIEITKSIRKALLADSSLSTYAHNVKIITVNSKVLLKGPVRSAAEKQKVESIAKKIAGNTPVNSEIEVAPK